MGIENRDGILAGVGGAEGCAIRAGIRHPVFFPDILEGTSAGGHDCKCEVLAGGNYSVLRLLGDDGGLGNSGRTEGIADGRLVGCIIVVSLSCEPLLFCIIVELRRRVARDRTNQIAGFKSKPAFIFCDGVPIVLENIGTRTHDVAVGQIDYVGIAIPCSASREVELHLVFESGVLNGLAKQVQTVFNWPVCKPCRRKYAREARLLQKIGDGLVCCEVGPFTSRSCVIA